MASVRPPGKRTADSSHCPTRSQQLSSPAYQPASMTKYSAPASAAASVNGCRCSVVGVAHDGVHVVVEDHREADVVRVRTSQGSAAGGHGRDGFGEPDRIVRAIRAIRAVHTVRAAGGSIRRSTDRERRGGCRELLAGVQRLFPLMVAVGWPHQREAGGAGVLPHLPAPSPGILHLPHQGSSTVAGRECAEGQVASRRPGFLAGPREAAACAGRRSCRPGPGT